MIKKKALFKRLKNIEDKSEEQLQVIKDQEEKPRSLKILERIKQKKQLMKLAKKKIWWSKQTTAWIKKNRWDTWQCRTRLYKNWWK